jgi:hypothetical protein
MPFAKSRRNRTMQIENEVDESIFQFSTQKVQSLHGLDVFYSYFRKFHLRLVSSLRELKIHSIIIILIQTISKAFVSTIKICLFRSFQ